MTPPTPEHSGDEPVARSVPSSTYAVLSLNTLAASITGATPRMCATRLVCVDGPAGSGKTTLAGELAERMHSSAVVHMDDVYRGWDTDFDETRSRVWSQLLKPLAEGRPGRYQHYDWTNEQFADWIDVPVPEVLVLEGVGSGGRRWADVTTLLVWIDAPREVRIDRGVTRDGADVLDHWLAWMKHEEADHRRQRTRERSDLLLCGHAADADLHAYVAVVADRRVPGR